MSTEQKINYQLKTINQNLDSITLNGFKNKIPIESNNLIGNGIVSINSIYNYHLLIFFFRLI